MGTTRLPRSVDIPTRLKAEAAIARLNAMIQTRTPIGPQDFLGATPYLEGYAHDGRFRVAVERRIGELRRGPDSFRVVAEGRVIEAFDGSRLTARLDVVSARFVRLFRVVFLSLILGSLALVGLLAMAGGRGTAPLWVFVMAPIVLGLLAEAGFWFGFNRADRDAELLAAALVDAGTDRATSQAIDGRA
jgi:hypothetical protein